MATGSSNPGRKSESSEKAGSKRKPINIEDSPKHKQPKLADSQFSQSQQEWDDAEDERRANEVVDLTQQEADNADLASVGTSDTKVVGCRFYSGIATVGEHVLLKREPSNPYDRNAIRIDNVYHEQIGHINRSLAAKLAPLIDNGTVVAGAIVAGPKAYYDMPIQLEFFAPENVKESAKQTLKSAGVPIKRSQEEIERERAEREKKKAEMAALKEREKANKRAKVKLSKSGGAPTGEGDVEMEVDEDGEFAGSWSQANKEKDSLAQAYNQLLGESTMLDPREVGDVANKFGVGEDELVKMPSAKQPSRLSTPMLPYQLQGLAWLLQKEHPQPPASQDDVVQLWRRKGSAYQNIATLFTTSNLQLASGGILADDMGLGKTLQMIALITADVKDQKDLVPSPKVNASGCDAGTLIIAPVSVMSNWTGQIAYHVSQSDPMTVFTYHGAGRKGVKLGDFDVVVSSYGTLVSEFNPKAQKQNTGLFKYEWRRIICDEAHILRNPNSKSSLACHSLKAESRWCLSGTPIVNSLKDLYSLVRFIGYTGGLADWALFNRILMRPLNRGSPVAKSLLQVLMATLCLRRTKEMKFVDLRLPGIQELVHKVKFWTEEKEKYDVLELEAKGMLARVGKGKSANPQDDYRFLLEILLRMRQVCNHQSLCGERIASLMKLSGKDRVELNPENVRALQDVLQMAIDAQEDCSICLEQLHNPRITICKHVFGLECIEKVVELQHKCPMCRCELKDMPSSVVEPMVIEDPTEAKDPNHNNSSSKVEALLKVLKASMAKDPGTKTVIFSQWTSFLSILEPKLEEEGLGFSRLDGSMRPKQRDDSITNFSADPNCKVLLASLAVANVGLNLVMANQVVLADSWWAPAVEEQAVDRVYRLGQKRAVTVWRLIIEGGIEERVLEIQAKKKELIETAFREKKRRRGNRMGDIAALLS